MDDTRGAGEGRTPTASVRSDTLGTETLEKAPCPSLVDAFGRVHVSAIPDSTPKPPPTVLTKLKKWADYESVGAPVYPTKFLPMKTPMSEEIIENWSLEHPPRHVLTVRRLIESQERAYGRKVGLIIDLANHDCLYIEDLLEWNGGRGLGEIVEYVRVGLVAKEVPEKGVVEEVARVVREFWGRKPESYVGVHCCYGFNRTG